MDNQKELRQALNQFTIVGTLKENNLELKDDLVDFRTHEKYRAMVGDLVVKVGELDEHKVSFFARELTKKGDVSKLFTAYHTIMNTYVSIADCTESDDESEGRKPTRLQIQGDISISDDTSSGAVKTYPRLTGKFVKSIKQAEVEDEAQFDLEVYIDKLSPEMDKNGIETERLKINGVVPIWGGKVIPVTLMVTEEYGVADYMTLNFVSGDTIKVWGDIYNSAVETKKEKSGFGKARDIITYDYKRELLIIGGEENPLGEDKAFSPETIKIALQERENFLQGKLSGGAQSNSRATGFANRAKAAPKKERSVGDIPF